MQKIEGSGSVDYDVDYTTIQKQTCAKEEILMHTVYLMLRDLKIGTKKFSAFFSKPIYNPKIGTYLLSNVSVIFSNLSRIWKIPCSSSPTGV